VTHVFRGTHNSSHFFLSLFCHFRPNDKDLDTWPTCTWWKIPVLALFFTFELSAHFQSIKIGTLHENYWEKTFFFKWVIKGISLQPLLLRTSLRAVWSLVIAAGSGFMFMNPLTLSTWYTCFENQCYTCTCIVNQVRPRLNSSYRSHNILYSTTCLRSGPVALQLRDRLLT